MNNERRGITEGELGDEAEQGEGLPKTEGEPFVCRTLFQGGAMPDEETVETQKAVDSGEELDTEYERCRGNAQAQRRSGQRA